MGRRIMTVEEDLKQELKQLSAERDVLEKEIAGHLDALPPVDGPLVDAEGFPRADIDVAAVRFHRQRLIMLRNDHRQLDDRLGVLLEKLHAAARPITNGGGTVAQLSEAQPHSESGAGLLNHDPSPSDRPAAAYAIVEEVSSGSPASEAGLELGDRIIAFGDITRRQPNPVQATAQSLQSQQGQAVRVLLLRRGQQTELAVTPHAWNGQGLLGARLRQL